MLYMRMGFLPLVMENRGSIKTHSVDHIQEPGKKCEKGLTIKIVDEDLNFAE